MADSEDTPPSKRPCRRIVTMAQRERQSQARQRRYKKAKRIALETRLSDLRSAIAKSSYPPCQGVDSSFLPGSARDSAQSPNGDLGLADDPALEADDDDADWEDVPLYQESMGSPQTITATLGDASAATSSASATPLISSGTHPIPPLPKERMSATSGRRQADDARWSNERPRMHEHLLRGLGQGARPRVCQDCSASQPAFIYCRECVRALCVGCDDNRHQRWPAVLHDREAVFANQQKNQQVSKLTPLQTVSSDGLQVAAVQSLRCLTYDTPCPVCSKSCWTHVPASDTTGGDQHKNLLIFVDLRGTV